MSLTKTRNYYKPFQYPWAFEYYKEHEQMHWLPEEVNIAEDLKDFRTLPESTRRLITQLLRFFTQADLDVAGGYANEYLPFFKAPEVRMMLSSFAAREAVHQDAYSLVLETLGFDDSEYSKFMEIQAMAEKHEHLNNFGMDTPENVAKTMAVYSAFTEGMQLFSSFAILLNLPRQNLMKGMGQIVTWSIRDESIHVEGMSKLFRTYIEENPKIWTDSLKYDIYSAAERCLELEIAFIAECWKDGASTEGMTQADAVDFAKWISNRRLLGIGMKPIFDVKENPIPWIEPMLNLSEHTNFFENRSTEYTKGSTTGSWVDIFPQ